MKLEEFLIVANGKLADIICYKSEEEAVKAVEADGYALRYVNPKIFEQGE